MKINQIPEHILEDVRNRGFSDDQIEKMEPARLFDEYCTWQGLLGWGFGLYEDVLELEAAAKREAG